MATEKLGTPKGKLEWVTITGEGKESLSKKMQYVANIVLTPEAAAPVIKKINDFWAENKPKGVKTPKSVGYYQHKVKTDKVDEDGDAVYEETGNVYLSFKTGTTFPDGSHKKVKTYNSKAKEVNLGETRIGNGSIGEIAGAMGIYQVTDNKNKIIDAGVTLYLDSIKISKLEEFTNDPGFTVDDDEDDEEGGWTGEDDFVGVDSAEGKAAPRL